MLLDDDVMAERETKPGSLTRRLGRKEGIEHLLPDFRRNPGTVIADGDLHPVAEGFRCRCKRRLISVAALLRFALGRGVKAIRDQVEQNAGDFLREAVDLAGGRIEEPFQGDVETLLLGTGTVIGKID